MDKKMKFYAPGDESIHIGLTSGHTALVDPKAEPNGTELEQHFHREAIARGCIPAGIVERAIAAREKPFDRMESITRNLEAMVDGDDPDDFLPNGNPNKAALDKRLGFTCERTEMEAAWQAIIDRTTSDEAKDDVKDDDDVKGGEGDDGDSTTTSVHGDKANKPAAEVKAEKPATKKPAAKKPAAKKKAAAKKTAAK